MISIISPTPASRPKRSIYALDATEAANVLLSMSTAEYPLKQSPAKRVRPFSSKRTSVPDLPSQAFRGTKLFLDVARSSNLDEIPATRTWGTVPLFVLARPAPAAALQKEPTVKLEATCAAANKKDASWKYISSPAAATSPAGVTFPADQAQRLKDMVCLLPGAADDLGPATDTTPLGASALSRKSSAGPAPSDVFAPTAKIASPLPPKKRQAKAKKDINSFGFSSSQASSTLAIQTAAPQAPMHHGYVQPSPFSTMPKTNSYSIEHAISWPPPNTSGLNHSDNKLDSSIPSKRVITTSVERTHSQPGPPRLGWSHQEAQRLLGLPSSGIPISTTSTTAVPMAVPTAPSLLELSPPHEPSLAQATPRPHLSSSWKDLSYLQEHHLPSVVEALSRPSFGPPISYAAPASSGFYSIPVVTETHSKYTQPGNSSPSSDTSTHLHFSVDTNPMTQPWTKPTPCNRTVITEVSPRFGYRR